MFCGKCGSRIEPGMKFCSECGEPAPADNAVTAENSALAGGAPVQPAVELSKSAEQPVQAADAKSSPVDALMNEYYRAAEGNSEPQQASAPVMAAPVQPEMPQPERYTAPAAPVEKPKKKKSRLIPICAAAGGVVVLAATGFIVYNCNKAAFTHAAMGDAGYAHSFVMGAVSNSSTQLLVEKSMQSAAANSSLQNAVYSVSSSDMPAVSMEYSAAILSEMLGSDGIQASLSANVELDSSFAEDLKDMASSAGMDEDDFDKLLKSISELKFTAAEKYGKDAIEYSAKVSVGGDNLGEAQARYEKDGTATFIFPGITKKGIEVELPEHTWDELEKEAPKTFDYSKFVSKVSEKTRKIFDGFKYDYVNESTEVGGVEFNGVAFEVKLDNEDVYKLLGAVIEVALEDDDFIEFYAQMTGYSVDSTRYDLESSLDSVNYRIENDDFNDDTYHVTLYINNDNSVAGARFKYKSGYNSSENVDAYLISNGVDSAASYKYGSTEYFRLRATGKSASEGTAKLTVTTPNYYYGDQTYSFKVDYKNVGLMSVFGAPGMKGEFEVSVDRATAASIFGDEYAGKIADGRLLYSIVPSGKGAKVTVGVSHEDYGKASISLDITEASGNIAPKPSGDYKLYDIDDIDEDFYNDVMDEVETHFEELADKDIFAKIILEMFKGSVNSYPIVDNYEPYENYSF